MKKSSKVSGLVLTAFIACNTYNPAAVASPFHRPLMAPMTESIIAQASAQSTQNKNIDKVFKSKKIDEKIKDLHSLSPEEKIEKLYKIFAVKNGGLKTDGSERPPRSIDETLAYGGDCNEFAIVLAAAMKKLGLEGGAYILRAKNAPEGVVHVVPYAKIGKDKIIIDPQASEINMVLDGSGYKILATLSSLDQLAYTYYREYGDYYRKKNQFDNAIKSYEKAYEIFSDDPYVVYGLMAVFHKKGDLANAAKYAEEYLAFENRKDFMGGKKDASATKWANRIKFELLFAQGTEKCAANQNDAGKADLEAAKQFCKENNVCDKNDLTILDNNIKNCK